jgi:hypothetical protein
MPGIVERQGCLLNGSKNEAARPEERRSRCCANGKKLIANQNCGQDSEADRLFGALCLCIARAYGLKIPDLAALFL